METIIRLHAKDSMPMRVMINMIKALSGIQPTDVLCLVYEGGGAVEEAKKSGFRVAFVTDEAPLESHLDSPGVMFVGLDSDMTEAHHAIYQTLDWFVDTYVVSDTAGACLRLHPYLRDKVDGVIYTDPAESALVEAHYDDSLLIGDFRLSGQVAEAFAWNLGEPIHVVVAGQEPPSTKEMYDVLRAGIEATPGVQYLVYLKPHPKFRDKPEWAQANADMEAAAARLQTLGNVVLMESAERADQIPTQILLSAYSGALKGAAFRGALPVSVETTTILRAMQREIGFERYPLVGRGVVSCKGADDWRGIVTNLLTVSYRSRGELLAYIEESRWAPERLSEWLIVEG